MKLQSSVSVVSGIGPQKEKELNGLGIHTVMDLLEYFPFRYEDLRLREITDLQDGEKATVEAEIIAVPIVQMYGRKKSRMVCKALVGGVLVTTVWFNRHFLKSRLHPGKMVAITGKWEQSRRQLVVSEAELGTTAEPQAGRLQPVYAATASISQRWLRETIRRTVQQFGSQMEEILPRAFLAKRRLSERSEAILAIHQPDDMKEAQHARQRLVYEELLFFQLKLQVYRQRNTSKKEGWAKQIDMEAVRSFVRSLPFALTPSQKKVVKELLTDLKASHCMNRLLQGDVGSGKTVVAAIALYANFSSGFQGVLMAPTEILAEQHSQSLKKLFDPYGLQIGLLKGSLTARQRRDVLAGLQIGMIDIVVGTHALIQDDVFFKQLGLVVTDEQHRFGVNQRSILRRKGLYPDILAMTATPIPRTMAITAFGDMDVSTITELPQGRKAIETFWVKHDMMERIIRFIRKQVEQGRQAYLICPLIEESEKLDVQNALDFHAMLSAALADIKVGILHGRLPAQEKDLVMSQFKINELQVLVSTTVVEVGVDVPNATLMVIYDADRFGLSQLHQLRGRVGRGAHQSYCILMADPKSDTGRERMKAMTETLDGFEIARRDLELRGPGDFFGTKQSGVPEFKLADLAKDYELLEWAREDAIELVNKEDFWTAVSYAPLRAHLQLERIWDENMLD